MRDGDHGQVVKSPFRQVDVHDFGKKDFGAGGGRFFRGPSRIHVLHGGNAHHRGGINGVTAMGDGGDMKSRKILRRRIKAGIIAKGPFGPEIFPRIHIPFITKSASAGTSMSTETPFYQQTASFRINPARIISSSSRRQGGRRRVGENRSPPKATAMGIFCWRSRYLKPSAVALDLPVHACGQGVEFLEAVHAAISGPGLGVFREFEGEGDIGPPSFGQHVIMGKRFRSGGAMATS